MGGISNILAGIADPAIADVPGAFKRGQQTRRQDLSREMVSQILGGTKAGQLGALAKENAPLALNLAEKMGFFKAPLQQTQEFIGTMQFASATAKSGATKEANAILVEYRNRQAALSLPTDKIDGIIQMMDTDPAQATEALGLMVDAFVEQGLAKSPDAGKSVSELRKEVRADLRKQVTDVSKQASAVQTNFRKIQGLTAEISKGNRSAAAQSLIALVKLGEPDSTVREGEMLAALNTQNPIAAIAQLLKGTGSSDEIINAVTASVDPLSPNIIKVDDLLATANALVGANVPVIQSKFAEAREQGEENLTPRGLKSIFTNRLTERVSGLSNLIQAGSSAGITDAQIQELKAARPDLTEEQIRAALQK